MIQDEERGIVSLLGVKETQACPFLFMHAHKPMGMCKQIHMHHVKKFFSSIL